MTTTTAKAIVCSQNDQTFYLTVLNSSVLSKACYVSAREEDPEKGFQRMLNESRAKDIAKYLDEDSGVIPSAIILSAQPAADFEYEKSENIIRFNITEKSFMIIDGQHRLFGFQKTKKDYQVPVVIFENLKTSDEVNLFIDINTTQKGVSSALLLDIKNLTGKETKVEERQRTLFDNLNRKEDSALKGILSPTKSAPGKISKSLFNESTRTIFDTTPFNRHDDEKIYKAVNNYIKAMIRAFYNSKREEPKIYKSVYFKATFSIFHEVVDKTLKNHADLKEESFYDTLEPISTIDFSQYVGSSNAAATKLIATMKEVLNKYNTIKITDEMF